MLQFASVVPYCSLGPEAQFHPLSLTVLRRLTDVWPMHFEISDMAKPRNGDGYRIIDEIIDLIFLIPCNDFNGYVYSLCVFRTQTSWVFASCIQNFDACRSEQIWTWPWICRYLQPEWLYLTCAYQGAHWGSWRKCWEWQANHPWPPVKQKRQLKP